MASVALALCERWLENFKVQNVRPQFYPIPWYIDSAKREGAQSAP